MPTQVKNTNYLIASIFMTSLCIAQSVWADEFSSDESTAPSFNLGGVKVYPGLGIAEKSDSNIHISDANKQSSMITVVSPSVLFSAKQDADKYSLSYTADLGRYDQSSSDNYNDQDLLADANVSFSTRTSIRFTPDYKLGHDPVGSTYGANSTPNTWQNAGAKGVFKYGAEDAPAGFELDAGYIDLEYQDNPTVTYAYNRFISNGGAIFNYRVAPKVTTFVQINDTSLAYKDSGTASQLNSTEQGYMLGATWEKTAQSSGSIKVGGLQKQFNSSSQSSFNLPSWEGAIKWSPVEYIKVELMSAKYPVEATWLNNTGTSLVGSFELVTKNSLDLAYDLTELTSVHVNAGNYSENFVGFVVGSDTSRTDVTNSFGIKAEYKIQSWLISSLEYTNAVKSSTDSIYSYNRDIVILSIRTQM